jgi:ABC-type sulfate transport system substrate-binding protein
MTKTRKEASTSTRRIAIANAQMYLRFADDNAANNKNETAEDDLVNAIYYVSRALEIAHNKALSDRFVKEHTTKDEATA